MSKQPPAPRPGRPRGKLGKQTPAVARILLGAAESLLPADRETVRQSCRFANPSVASVGRALAILRPHDTDGGWGWFGQELTKTK